MWQNSSSLPDQQVAGEEEVTGWINPTQSERHWRSTIVMASQASPHLAFHMINRSHDTHVITLLQVTCQLFSCPDSVLWRWLLRR